MILILLAPALRSKIHFLFSHVTRNINYYNNMLFRMMKQAIYTAAMIHFPRIFDLYFCSFTLVFFFFKFGPFYIYFHYRLYILLSLYSYVICFQKRFLIKFYVHNLVHSCNYLCIGNCIFTRIFAINKTINGKRAFGTNNVYYYYYYYQIRKNGTDSYLKERVNDDTVKCLTCTYVIVPKNFNRVEYIVV